MSKGSGRTGSKGVPQEKEGTWKLSPYSLFQRKIVKEQMGDMVVRSSVTAFPNADIVSEYKLSMEQSRVACQAGGKEVIHVKSEALAPELPSLSSNDPHVRRDSVLRLQDLQILKESSPVELARSEVKAGVMPAEVEDHSAAEVQETKTPRNQKLKPVEGAKSRMAPLVVDSSRKPSVHEGGVWSPRSLPGDASGPKSPRSPTSPWSPKSTQSTRSRRSLQGVKLRPVWDIEGIKDAKAAAQTAQFKKTY